MNIYIRYTLTLISFLLLSHIAGAQIITDDKPQPGPDKTKSTKTIREDKVWDWSRFYVGGFPSFGIGGGNGGTSISAGLSTEVGYFVHDRVAVGVRGSYLFGSVRYNSSYSWKYHLLAGSPYLRGYVWKGLFGQAEYQFTNFLNEIDDPAFNADFTLRNSALLIGGGFHDNFENGFGYYLGIMFNVLNTGYYPYPNPDFRIGLTYRLPEKD